MRTIPTLLIAGYLGSGKTTLVNHLLANAEGLRFAVVVNDIGEVNIDARLIQQGGVVSQEDQSLVALQNGCICCTLQDDLARQLLSLSDPDRFDYIAVEASGVCEPAPIAHTIEGLAAHPAAAAAKALPKLDNIVAVVDAARLRDEFDGAEELRRPHAKEDDLANLVIQQVEFCNTILLNKASDVEPEELERMAETLRAIQPVAEIIPCDRAEVGLDKILNTGAFDFERTATSATWIKEVERREEHEEEEREGHEHHHEHEHEHHHEHEHEHEGHGHHHHHHHHDHEHGETEEYGIGTFVYQSRKPLSLSLFDDFVARRWPKGIIRAKGICYFKGEEDMCYLFEQAGRQFDLRNCGQWYATMPPDELERLMAAEPSLRQDWDEEYGDRMQRIVFIGRPMDAEKKQEIARALDACRADNEEA